jgi:single-strand DNA-binding protein
MAEVNTTVIGYVGNDLAIKVGKTENVWTQFRVGSTRSWRDSEGKWSESPTMWFTVKLWGHKAKNAVESLRRGTPVVVVGRLSEEPYVVSKTGENGETITEVRNGLMIENATVAVDITRGVVKYVRTDRDVPDPEGNVSAFNKLPESNVSVMPVLSQGVELAEVEPDFEPALAA